MTLVSVVLLIIAAILFGLGAVLVALEPYRLRLVSAGLCLLAIALLLPQLGVH